LFQHPLVGRKNVSMARHEGTVIFNVGGKHYEVLRQTIDSRPGTLLSSLLDDIDTDVDQPIFVDANPDRFAYVLDWYRHGEIHLPTGYPVRAVLNDARFFLLPDSVYVNGCPHELQAARARQTTSEDDLRGAAASAVFEQWHTFEQYVADLVAEVQNGVRNKLRTLSEQAASVRQVSWEEEPATVPTRKKFRLAEYADDQRQQVWCDPKNVCNKERLQFLVAELKRRGLECNVDWTYSALWLSVGLQNKTLWDNSARG